MVKDKQQDYKQQGYEARFRRVLTYIDVNISEAVKLDELASVACFSPFHFHRQFSEYVGVPVFKYILLKRLERATYQLLFRKQMSITEVALDAGFETPEAFTRAFRREVGTSPSHFRKTADHPATIDLKPMKQGEKTMDTEVEIVDFQALDVAAFEHVGPASTIMQSVAAFIEWRKENRLPPSKSRTFNLLYDDPDEVPPSEYRMDICAELKHTANFSHSKIVRKTIPAGQCAYMRHIGPWEGIEGKVRALYGEWLPNSGRELSDFPCFLERINFYPETSASELITDIYLPLRA